MAPATVISFIFMYCFLYLQNSEKLRSQEIMLANNRLAVLQNQIRPHFLYNTLNSIYYLCEKDPSAAQQAIGDFSEYMRANLESLEEIAVSFEGVDKAFAVQAGRELRILVNAETVSDDKAREIAKGIASRIEAELRYPGRIKVTIIREMRAVEYAK